MSNKVSTLVFSRTVGGASLKAVLAYMADKASDDGSGVWTSKATMAEETELSRATVFRLCKDLCKMGVIFEAGHRPCSSGFTVEYALNLEAIAALPRVGETSKGSHGDTSHSETPCHGETPPVSQCDPKGSHGDTQTILEPPLNQDDDDSAGAQTLREQILSKCGVDPISGTLPNGCAMLGTRAHMADVDRWRADLGLSEAEIVAVVSEVMARKTDGPPLSFKYFNGAMQKLAGAKSQTPLKADLTGARPNYQKSQVNPDDLMQALEGL